MDAVEARTKEDGAFLATASGSSDGNDLLTEGGREAETEGEKLLLRLAGRQGCHSRKTKAKCHLGELNDVMLF